MSPSASRSLRLDRFRRVITDAPVSYSVYSAFSFYGSRRGGELPGTWLVAALGTLGHEVPAIRQTLYRMEAGEELTSRAEGRTKFYALSAYAQAEAQAGLTKIMNDEDADWDGEWTLVQLRGDARGSERIERERFREILNVEGFAALGPGLFIHPRARAARLIAAANDRGVQMELEVFRAHRVSSDDDRELVARLWDLDGLATRYRRFVARYEPVARLRRGLTPESAFVLRFAVVFDYLESAWRDPELVPRLLPAPWPGAQARQLARRLYTRLLPDAIAFGDAILR